MGFRPSVAKACRTWLHQPHLARADRAARRLHARHAAAGDVDARHLAVLDEVDAHPIGRARIAPCDGVVAGGAPARMEEAAVDREPPLLEVEIGQDLAHAVAIEQPRGISMDLVNAQQARRALDYLVVQPFDELLVQRNGLFWRSGADEGRTHALPGAGEEGELADHQGRAAGIPDAPIHFAGVVREDPERRDLAREQRRGVRGVAGLDADKHHEAGADRRDLLARDVHRGRGYPLQHRSHGVDGAASPLRASTARTAVGSTASSPQSSSNVSRSAAPMLPSAVITR